MKERIYKGATRPAMVLGVPLKVGVPVAGVGVVLSMWGGWVFGWKVFTAFAAATLMVLLWMRAVTAKDDQRLLQKWKSWRMKWLHGNRGLWKCRSYSPTVYKDSDDAWFH
ncbi:VirB3 family type IV secretion system protein [Azohydromonas aeria]|uniref:VirB3 family type IV secretion system protein n=1 Tax=Azohydromonas aeria TaxID=2590212 RepID=UPI0012FC15DA|nr:VirB3 family type IV secretion system protein [Azohydromonas aeria]